jgi:type II secretory pathway pseudopilin PulG
MSLINFIRKNSSGISWYKLIKSVIGYSVLAVGLLLASGIWYFTYLLPKEERDQQQTEHIGNEIIKELQEYYSDHNHYPATLRELGIIPEPAWGDRWEYRASDNGDIFELLTGYKKRDGAYSPALYYHSADTRTQWHYADEDGSIEF